MKFQSIIREHFPDCHIKKLSLKAVEGWTEYGTGDDKVWLEYTGTLPDFAELQAKETEFELSLTTRNENREFNKPILARIAVLEGNETHRRMAEAIIDEDGTGRKFIFDNRALIKTQRKLLRTVE